MAIDVLWHSGVVVLGLCCHRSYSHVKSSCQIFRVCKCSTCGTDNKHGILYYMDDMLLLLHRMQNGRKTRSERLEMPTFSTVIEIQDRHTWRVHGDVAASVDSILAGSAPTSDCRHII